ncbi:hypothetical protein OQA88_11083 [Cercophora sp. LCS_1]
MSSSKNKSTNNPSSDSQGDAMSQAVGDLVIGSRPSPQNGLSTGNDDFIANPTPYVPSRRLGNSVEVVARKDIAPVELLLGNISLENEPLKRFSRATAAAASKIVLQANRNREILGQELYDQDGCLTSMDLKVKLMDEKMDVVTQLLGEVVQLLDPAHKEEEQSPFPKTPPIIINGPCADTAFSLRWEGYFGKGKRNAQEDGDEPEDGDDMMDED